MFNHATPTVPAVAVPLPENLYSFSDFPAPNVEMTLYPTKARVEVVLTPESVEITQKRVIDETTGNEQYYSLYEVEGKTDRGDIVSFTAKTVPGMEDEIVLDSVLTFSPDFTAILARNGL